MSDDDDTYEEDEECEYNYEEYDPDNEEEDEENESGTIVVDILAATEESTTSGTTKPKSPHQKKKPGNYSIIDFCDVGDLVCKNVDDLTSLLECDRNVSQYLLQYYNWDKEKIIENYFSDPEKLNSVAGVDLYNPEQVARYLENKEDESITNTTSEALKVSCRVCYDEFQELYKDMFGLGCGHLFCKDCFGAYLKSQVVDGPMCVIAHCPEFKCKQGVTPNVFCAFLSPDDRQNYDRYVARRFIECSKAMRYCPAPNCEKVAVSSGGKTNIICDCTYNYCFECGEEAHDPASCSQLSKWNEKCASDGESAKWIFANTKKCPKCNTRIEKNQGCNHMTCRQCKHEFCWICMGDWRGHSACNRYNSEDQKTELNAIQKAKAELDRYLHYYNRYQAHDLALKIASKQRLLAEARMKERQNKKSDAWIDVQFIHEAVEQVIACRRVLKYTYVIGFYMPENSPEKLLFERHQEMLEENTEKLHGCTEQKNIFSIDRTQVVNWTRITEKFRNSLLENFSDGHMLGGGESSMEQEFFLKLTGEHR